MRGLTRPSLVLAVLVVLFVPVASQSRELTPQEGYSLLRQALSHSARERREAARQMVEAGDRSLAPGLVEAYFFLPRNARAEALSTLKALTGERPGERYQDWVEVLGRRADLAPKEGYLEWKAELLARIDPRYPKILYPGAPARLRLEEVVWGGVKIEGIPALDRPRHAVSGATEARYLDDSEPVFGVKVGGVARAYPLRILDWHEMVNDEVGGEPITISYCTLCRSAVLYSARNPAGGAYTFGTSGLLYRSNKLMVDRQSLTLWNNLTGEPVLGRLANSPVRLEVLPLTRTTWKDWRTRHPQTTVLALDEEMARRWGYDYRPGAADRRRAGVSFPVWQRSDALDPKDEVFAVRLGTVAKAYALKAVLRERVVNDRLGEEPLVVVGDPETGAVRAYRRGTRTFRGDVADTLIDDQGRRWTVGEEALVPPEGEAPLERVPGHLSYWFGWYGFFPQTELYGGRGR